MPKVLYRKNRNPMLGKRYVRLVVGKSKEEFNVNLELLCLNSPYFRSKLQPKRKPLDDEADRECVICQESIDLEQDSLQYCARQCGKNFHATCLNKWLEKEKKSTCPNCRAQWLVLPLRTHVVKLPRLSEDGLRVYLEWIHHKRIWYPDYESETDGKILPDANKWIAAYFTGVEIEDNKFCQALFHAKVQLCVEVDGYPNLSLVKEAYDGTADGAPLRAFMVALYTLLPKRILKKDPNLSSAPAEFLADFIKAESDAKGKLPAEWDLEEVQSKICLDVDHTNSLASEDDD